MTHTYAVGEKVFVKKYGDEYFATVTAVGRTTVTVEFKTKGGTTKTYKVPGYKVAYDLTPATGRAGRFLAG